MQPARPPAQETTMPVPRRALRPRRRLRSPHMPPREGVGKPRGGGDPTGGVAKRRGRGIKPAGSRGRQPLTVYKRLRAHRQFLEQEKPPHTIAPRELPAAPHSQSPLPLWGFGSRASRPAAEQSR